MRRSACRRDEATQLAEFAITLPLLVVFVVGIFDFSGAFTLKQKLTNIARDAARAAAADPATDLTSSLPYSVNDAFYVIDNYLVANNIDDCTLKTSNVTHVPGTLSWVFAINSTPTSPCGITVTMNRGYYFPIGNPMQPPGLTCTPLPPGNAATQVISTCITIQYTYQWRFGKVVSLLGNNAMLPTAITAEAIAMNEN